MYKINKNKIKMIKWKKPNEKVVLYHTMHSDGLAFRDVNIIFYGINIRIITN